MRKEREGKEKEEENSSLNSRKKTKKHRGQRRLDLAERLQEDHAAGQRLRQQHGEFVVFLNETERERPKIRKEKKTQLLSLSSKNSLSLFRFTNRPTRAARESR